MDLLSESEMRVRLMGTLVAEVLGEKTGSDASYYAEEIRAAAVRVAWTAGNYPCGYVVSRTLVTTSNMLIEAYGLVVPIFTDTPDCITLASYNDIEGESLGVAKKNEIETVKAFGKPRWLDIGAGVPDT